MHINTNTKKIPQRGFATLLTALIVSALGALIVVPVMLLGIAGERTGQAREQGLAARLLADSCAERALEEIRESASFSGSDTLTYSNGSCSYAVINEGGQNRTIEASGAVADALQRVELTLTQINPTITVAAWREVDAF